MFSSGLLHMGFQSFDRVTLRVEQKKFIVRIDDSKKRSIKIIEQHRAGTNVISIDFEGAHWIASQLLQAANRGNQQSFFSKRKINDQVVWLNRHENKKGQYMELYKNVNGVGANVVVPAGVKGKSWVEIAGAIELILNGGLKERKTYVKHNQSMARKATAGKKVDMGKHSERKNGECSNSNRDRASSFADIVKKNSMKQQILCGNEEAIEAVFDENLTIVCVREKVEDEWKAIEGAINEKFDCNVRLRPFQADRAFFVCKNEEEYNKFKERNFAFFKGALVVRFKTWLDDDGSMARQITFTGGWISIAGLPVSMWNERYFEKIADFCGGLLEIHEDTLKMSNCFEALIKARGNMNGFIPAAISISGKGGVYSLKLRNRSKLEMGFRRFLLKNPITAMDFAFSGVCGEDDDVEYDDLPNREERQDNALEVEANKEKSMNVEEREVVEFKESEEGEKSSGLISVEHIFSKLKSSLEGDVWASIKQGPLLHNFENRMGIYFKPITVTKPIKGRAWRVGKDGGLRRVKWASRLPLMTYERRKKGCPVLISIDEKNESEDEKSTDSEIREPHDDSKAVQILSDIDSNVDADLGGLIRDYDDDLREELIHNIVDREEEVSDDMYSSEGEREGSQTFDQVGDGSWLPELFEGAANNQYKSPNKEVTIELLQEVVANKSISLSGTKVPHLYPYSITSSASCFKSGSWGKNSSYSFISSKNDSSSHGPKGSTLNSQRLEFSETHVANDPNLLIAPSIGLPKDDHPNVKKLLENQSLAICLYEEPCINNNLIFKHHKEMQNPENGGANTPNSASNEGEEMGVSKEEWDRFSKLLNKMDVSLVPIQRKVKHKKSESKGSSRKGARELNNLKCGINYEREKGGRTISRGEIGHQ